MLLVHIWSIVPYSQYSLHVGVKTGLVRHTNCSTGCGRRQRPLKSSRATAYGHHQSTARTGQQARETIYTTVHHLHGNHERFNSHPLRYVILYQPSQYKKLTQFSPRSPLLSRMPYGSPHSRRKPGLRTRQRYPQMPRVPEKGRKTERSSQR